MATATSNLATIRQKVRRLTRSPSLQMLTDAELDQYVNTFVLYDFPQNLRVFDLSTTLNFTTVPNQDRYSTTTTNISDPLYDFKNKYSAVHPVVFFNGLAGFYTQKPDIFYGYYPPTQYQQDTSLAASGAAAYNSTTSQTPVLQRSFSVSAQDANQNQMTYEDRPIDLPATGALLANSGNLVLNRKLPVSATNPRLGGINYLTGVWDITFPAAAPAGQDIEVNYIGYTAGQPYAMLFYDNDFIIRPVPDKVYTVQLKADRYPTELLSDLAEPDIKEWWQYIALGTARKIFEDKLDMDSLRAIEPIFREQEMLVQRKTLCLAANERTTTIYTVGKSFGVGFFNWAQGPY
jgi:hypothetical protein